MPTKKHFEDIAAILSDFADEAPSAYEFQRVRTLAGDMATKFESWNPRFDRERFMVTIFGTNR